MNVSLIVAHGKNGELGLDNKLLWHIPEDLEHFKNLTNGHYVFMGRKTYDSILGYLKKPLPNRISLVLSNRDLNGFVNEEKVSSFEEAYNIAKDAYVDNIFIIGGASIYKEYFKEANVLYITETEYEGPADCYFKEDLSSFELKEETKLKNCVFKKYEKRDVF